MGCGLKKISFKGVSNMTVINTNISASITQNALSKNERAMAKTMEQLSTGKRVNSAADDAAGLAIVSRMTSQITGLKLAVRNANDAISMIQTADGALIEVTNLLQRMREIAVQAVSDTNTATDRDYLNLEFTQLRAEVERIADNTQWNGENVLDGSGGASSDGAYTFQIGANASQTVSITIADFQLDQTDGLGAANDISGINVDTAALATTALGKLDTAIESVSSERATMGSVMNRLEHAADNLTNVATNAEASRSRVEDADYAAATTELARTQIIAQAATAMLAQANQVGQNVLSLLK